MSGGLFRTLLVLAVTSSACETDPRADRSADRELVIFAASSLRDVFTTLGAEFERTHPGVEVVFNFAGTQQLRAHIEHGTAADVFASADERHMDQLERAGDVASPRLFTANPLVLIVARERAREIGSLEDLPEAERIVVGAPGVPVGRYTRQALERAGALFGEDFPSRVEARIASRELNVRQVLAKVVLGEADAGLVYASDARSAGDDVAVVELPPAATVVARYPIAVMRRAPNPTLAEDWIALLMSDAAQAVFHRAGFGHAP